MVGFTQKNYLDSAVSAFNRAVEAASIAAPIWSFTCACICLLCSAMFAGVVAEFELDGVKCGT